MVRCEERVPEGEGEGEGVMSSGERGMLLVEDCFEL